MDDKRKLKRKKERALIERNYDQVFNYSNELGNLYYDERDYDSALREFQAAEKAAKKGNNKLLVARASRMIGETLCAVGKFDEAIEHQKRHLEYAREEGNKVEQQRALATLGRTYFVLAESISDADDESRKRALDLCRQYYEKSLHICKNMPLSNQLGQKTLSEMKCRLYLNLGLCSESEGDTRNGIDFISKAINICKPLDLWEDLFRCYSSQGSLYFRLGDTSQALKRIDEALKIVEHLTNKVALCCEILSLKADVLISLSDFSSARHTLIKAYKMKSPDEKDREEIAKKLKKVELIYRKEKELLSTPENNFSRRRDLNEKIADYCAELGSYRNAITYYSKMLECALFISTDRKDLIPIYSSLWQTYKDNGQYKEALEYAEKEYELLKDNPVEACKTLTNIIDLMERQKERFSFNDIMESYQDALALAKKAGDLKLEALVLDNMMNSQIKSNRSDLADDTRKELDIIRNYLPEETSEENSPISNNDSIDLDQLSDIFSDNEEETHQRRKVTKSTLMKRNLKGETPLHIASANGNIAHIKNLLNQGHPVNVRDTAGWTPLHEACNHGQIEATQILIEAGADLEDRGGPECDGFTPLLDAASNGHLELIDLLLNKGASPTARNNDRKTALDCLLECRERAELAGELLDPLTQEYFDEVVKRLRNCLKAAGQDVQQTDSFTRDRKKRPKSSSYERPASVAPRLSRERSISPIQTRTNSCRRKIETESTDDDVDPIVARNATREYRNAMKALRHRNKNVDVSRMKDMEREKKPALLAEDDVIDDWLEDDVGDAARRPVKRRCEHFVGQQVRNANKFNSDRANKASTSTWDKFLEDVDFEDENEQETSISTFTPARSIGRNRALESDNEEDPDKQRDDQSALISLNDDFFPWLNNESRESQKPKYQKSLLSVGFQRFSPPLYSTQSVEQPITINSSLSRSSIKLRQITPTQQATKLKVKIEGKLFVIPVRESLDELTVGWLAGEAARRYQNTEGVEVVLNLTTDEGGLLDANDPLSLVISESEFHGVVTTFNLAPLVNRYREACNVSKIAVDRYLEQQLDICQVNGYFHVRDCCISLNTLQPVLTAILRQQNLEKICLSAVNLEDNSFKALIDSIAKLQNIRSLDVSVNNICNDGLAHFSSVVISSSFPVCYLEELDLSYNPLGEESASNLAKLMQCLTHLKSLRLKFVGLMPQSLHGLCNFHLDSLQLLDISDNELGREGISKFLSSIDVSKTRSLNLSNTGGADVISECILFLDGGRLYELQDLYLSNLELDDDDVEKLIQPLSTANQLKKLDLSNNLHITAKIYKSLSALKDLKELNLSGCEVLNAQEELHDLLFCRLHLSSKICFTDFKEAPYNYITNNYEFDTQY